MIRGALYGVLSLKVFFIIEVCIEFLAVVFLLTIRVHKAVDAMQTETTQTDVSIRKALIYVKDKKTILQFVFNFLFMNVFMAALSIGLPYIIATGYANETIIIGVLRFVTPVGMIFASILFGRSKFTAKFYNKVLLSFISMGIVMLGLGISTLTLIEHFYIYAIVIAVLTFIFGASLTVAKIPLMSFFQMSIASEYQGRLFGVLDSVSQSAMPIGIAIFGLLFDHYETHFVLLGAGAIYTIYI